MRPFASFFRSFDSSTAQLNRNRENYVESQIGTEKTRYCNVVILLCSSVLVIL